MKTKTVYAQKSSVTLPQKRSGPAPEPPRSLDVRSFVGDPGDATRLAEKRSEEMDQSNYEPPSPQGPRWLSQARLNDIVRHLHLSKDDAEWLTSRLQEDGLIEPTTRVTYYRTRNQEFMP